MVWNTSGNFYCFYELQNCLREITQVIIQSIVNQKVVYVYLQSFCAELFKSNEIKEFVPKIVITHFVWIFYIF